MKCKAAAASSDCFSRSQTLSANCLSFELAEVKDRSKFKIKVAPLMPGCVLN